MANPKMNLIRFDPTLKAYMLAICARDRISIQALVTLAVTEYIHAHAGKWNIKLPEPVLCAHCFKELKNQDNKSGFCRACQRKHSLSTLENIHPEKETRNANPAKALAVILSSGGMDSCVTTAIAHQEYRLAMLHVGYGQRTEKRELQAFNAMADFYQAEHRLACRLDHLQRIGGSSLTDSRIAVERADLTRREIPSSYVPFRNAHFLSIAVSWGEVLGARKIFVGAVAEDSSGYPDCRPEYYDAFNRVIAVGTKPETHLDIVTPVIHLRKSEIVRRGITLGAPLGSTWSCYQAEDIACGVCDSCALRLRAFEEAGVRDPIPYRERVVYK